GKRERTLPFNWTNWMGRLRRPAKAPPIARSRGPKTIPDVGEFVRDSLGFPADEIQALVLRAGGRVIVKCTRQWGKSTLAAAWVQDALYQAMRPTLVAGDGDLCLISTPCGQRGFFYQVWSRGGPEWERIRVPATECPRIRKSVLDEERAALDENKFKQEYLC